MGGRGFGWEKEVAFLRVPYRHRQVYGLKGRSRLHFIELSNDSPVKYNFLLIFYFF